MAPGSLLQDFPGNDAYQVAPASAMLRLRFLFAWADSTFQLPTLPTRLQQVLRA